MSSIPSVPSFFPIMQTYIFNINFAIIILGFFGNIFNILIFKKLTIFRNNPSSYYLTIESIFNNIMLATYFSGQILTKIYLKDVANISLAWCKIRTFYVPSCRLTATYIICFEAIDQFLSTHYQFHIRQKSTIRLARYLVWSSCIIWFLQSIPYAIFSEIVSGVGCTIVNQILLNYYSYFYFMFLLQIFPILVSSLFSLLAYQNVRRLVRLQNPIHRRKLDQQLTAMIFIRVIAFTVLLIPNVCFRVYLTTINKNSVYFVGGVYQVVVLLSEWFTMWIYGVSNHHLLMLINEILSFDFFNR